MRDLKVKFTDFKAAVFLFLVGFLLYSHTLAFDIIYHDDYYLLIASKRFLEKAKDWMSIFNIFNTNVYFLGHGCSYYRPLLNLSFIFNQLVGGNIFFVRITNIFLFSMSGVLLFVLIRKMGKSLTKAFMLSLFFLVHPTLMPLAVWIPGRNDSMLAVFVFLFFINFLSYIESRNVKSFSLVVISFVLAIFTKENAVILPLLIVVYAYLKKSNLRMLIPILIVSFIVIGIWGVFKINSTEDVFVPFVKNGIVILKIFLYFLEKTIFPLEPLLYIPAKNLDYIYGLLAVILCFPLILQAIKSGNKISIFGMIFYLAFIFPFFILDFNVEGIGTWEQRVCLPVAGFIIFISDLEWNFPLQISEFLKKSIYIILLVYFALSSVVYSLTLANKFLFWEKIVEKFPQDVTARVILANMYQKMNSSYAEVLQKKVLDLNPKYPFVHHNLGIIYFMRNEIEKAEKEFEIELKYNPMYKGIYDKHNRKLNFLKKEEWHELERLKYGIFMPIPIGINSTNMK